MRKVGLWLLLLVVSVLALIEAWTMLYDTCSQSTALVTGETRNQCYTRWIGALSGWIAGAAAVLTLMYIRRTLVEAQKNNKLLAIQTRTVTGELDPVFNHNGPDPEDTGKEIFRFWNHHRRAITIDQIELVSPHEASFVTGAFMKPDFDDFTRFEPKTFRNGGRTISKTMFAEGTQVGASCKPITFKLAFANEDQHSSYVNILLRVRWRFRDANMSDTPPAPLECIAPVNAKPWISP